MGQGYRPGSKDRDHGSGSGVTDQGQGLGSVVRGWDLGVLMPLGNSLNTHSDGFSACQNSDHFVQNIGNPHQTFSILTHTVVSLED